MIERLAVTAVVTALASSPLSAQSTRPSAETTSPVETTAPHTVSIDPTQSERAGVDRRSEEATRFEPTEKISADSAVSFPVDI